MDDFIKTFSRIGLLSFGGPAAQIALMHRELVERTEWLSEKQFAGALSFCMLLPGPEAMQLATYAGWKLRGIKGGLQAGLLFIVPGALVIYALALLYINYGTQSWAQTVFLGIKAAVITIVMQALYKLAKRALKTPAEIALALAAFLGLFFAGLPYPFLLALAALAGALLFRSTPEETPSVPERLAPPNWHLLAIGALVWLAPLAAAALSGATFYQHLASYFAQLALLSFGGAYALLGWMTQTMVQDHGWITTTQMIDALGLAETTPGPLILVTQFTGHLAGQSHGGALHALWAGLLTLWTVFTPCFLYIFLGAPYLEHLLAMPRLAGALKGITAAVTGVIASLALWFALTILIATRAPLTPDWPALILVATGMAITLITRGNLFALVLGNGALAWLLATLDAI